MTYIIRVDKTIINNWERDKSISSYEYWLVEIDDKGTPLRELGFDKEGRVIDAAPTNRNRYGKWTDSPVLFDLEDDYERFTIQEFESIWDDSRGIDNRNIKREKTKDIYRKQAGSKKRRKGG